MKQHPAIGTRVRLNDGVAMPFIGITGTVIERRESVFSMDGTISVVQLDTPTAAATHWTPLQTLGVPACDIDAI